MAQTRICAFCAPYLFNAHDKISDEIKGLRCLLTDSEDTDQHANSIGNSDNDQKSAISGIEQRAVNDE